MAFTFDPEKSARNFAQRGLSFDEVARLDWDRALIDEDTRKDYGETRLLVLAPMSGRLFSVVVTPRGGDVRVISFRKASRKEIRKYGQKE